MAAVLFDKGDIGNGGYSAMAAMKAMLTLIMDTLAKSNPDWQPAGFYQVEGAPLRCTLCPHACRLAEARPVFARCGGIGRTAEAALVQARTMAQDAGLRYVQQKKGDRFDSKRLALSCSQPGADCWKYRIGPPLSPNVGDRA